MNFPPWCALQIMIFKLFQGHFREAEDHLPALPTSIAAAKKSKQTKIATTKNTIS